MLGERAAYSDLPIPPMVRGGAVHASLDLFTGYLKVREYLDKVALQNDKIFISWGAMQ